MDRVWLYSARSWKPAWYQRLGVPYRGMDEKFRHTLVIGFGLIGYLVVAYSGPCRCPDCVEVRQLIEEEGVTYG